MRALLKGCVSRIFFLPIISMLFISLSTVCSAATSDSGQGDQASYEPGRVLIKLKKSATEKSSPEKLNQLLASKGSPQMTRVFKIPSQTAGKSLDQLRARKREEIGIDRWRDVELNLQEDIEAFCEEAMATKEVEACHPNYRIKATFVPNDPYYHSTSSWGESMWGLKRMYPEPAWDQTQGEGVVVAVVDTGVYLDHEDIKENIWINPGEDLNHNGIIDGTNTCPVPNGDFNCADDDGNGYPDDLRGWNFVEEDPDQEDNWGGGGHGTHVAGTIAAVGNNGIGVVGVAPGAKIMPLKVMSTVGGWAADPAVAIVYAADMGARVINNSWGCDGPCPSNPSAEDAVRYAYAMGSVVVFAAGNDSRDAVLYSPNQMHEVISVAAVQSNDYPAYFTNDGPKVDVAAPGRFILSLKNAQGQYASFSGTSMATPHVSGLAALLVSLHPEYENFQIQWLIEDTVEAVPGLTAEQFSPGIGIVNANEAVKRSDKSPPLIAGGFSRIEVDSDAHAIRIFGSAEGEEFDHYRLDYINQDAGGDWQELYSSTDSVVEDLLAVINFSQLGVGTNLLRLTIVTADGRERQDYHQFVLGGLSYIRPEVIYSVREGGSGPYPLVRGAYPAGQSVLFTGVAVGQYYLEWRDVTGMGTWRGDFFDYGVGPDYLASWDTSGLDHGLYEVRLVDDAGEFPYTEIQLESDIKPGWPVAMDPLNLEGEWDEGELNSKVGNLDDDPEPELVTVRVNDKWARIYVIEHTGEVKPNWPVIIPDHYGSAAYPALADIDGDGKDEIFMTTVRELNMYDYVETVRAFQEDGSVIFERDFHALANSAVRLERAKDPLIVADLNQDGSFEILYRHTTHLYVMNDQGNDLSPWQFLEMEMGDPQGEGSINFMAVGAFDEDEDLEILVVQNKNLFSPANFFGDIEIVVMNRDGNCLNCSGGRGTRIGQYVNVDRVSSGDMDGDGLSDFVVVASDYMGGFMTRRLRGYRHNGDSLFVSDVLEQYGVAKNIMADVDGDYKADVIYQNGNKLEVRKYNNDTSESESLPGWPVDIGSSITPYIAADLDGDDEIEILGTYDDSVGNMFGEPPDSGYSNRKIIILNADGSIADNHPLNDRLVPSRVSSFLLTDLDLDGYSDLVMHGSLPHEYANNRRPFMVAYETGAPVRPGLAHWPMDFHDNQNTACLSGLVPNQEPAILSILDQTVTSGDTLTFTVSASDPDGDPLSFSVLPSLPAGATFTPTGSIPNTYLFSWTPSEADIGLHTITFQVTDGEALVQESVGIRVLEGLQRPWQRNENGTLITGFAWNYTLGYHFTPTRSGTIRELGGFFKGTKTVKLWNRDTGALLAEAEVTSDNDWAYTAITPVLVRAGGNYTVAVSLAGSGGAYRYGVDRFPRTYGDITIQATCYTYGNGRPTNSVTYVMYGQADIGFRPRILATPSRPHGSDSDYYTR